MADKKLEKALYGPSMTEVALGAVLGLIVGVLAACVYLIATGHGVEGTVLGVIFSLAWSL